MSDTCVECPSVEIHAKDRCRRCYQRDYMRSRRHAANPYLATWTATQPGHRVCRRCEQELSASEFGPRKNGRDGLSSWCRACTSARKQERRAGDPAARDRERAYEQRPDVRARIQARNAAREYGITVEEFEAMQSRQRGRCAVCQRERKLAVDHCHASERVRELLCYPCNIALGQVNDDVEILHRLAEYVERHRES